MTFNRGMKPLEVAARFPPEVLKRIYKFVPALPKTPAPIPRLCADLRRIQNTIVRGANEMYLRNLEDFIL